MTKQELIYNVTSRTGVDKTATSAVINEVIAVVQETLAKGESVYIRGLFTLTTKVRADKKARNITKGTTINVPAHVVPFAKFAKELKDRVKRCVDIK